ncbi:cysteine-rich and transmembrane domain-containing protein 1-like isoform X2 [Cottoperca gobio]|uniref:Cysteine-rich and transmembrane domain-containing protein 1 n=1 Tax=Cottoperca gobio TaxID=56716 RepID=A0A6J2R188_COTGO|nr:cysteine-rich and transmembrane domain-containing protein 1 isoform X2 [Cottoperca gobio]
MSYDRPPPYFPSHPEGPSAPGFAAVLSSQPAAFPGLPYQTIAQTCTAGGDQSYYQGPPCWTQPGYQVYHSGPPHQGEHPKQTVFVVEQTRDGGAKESVVAACSAALCCCCLWNILTSHH